MIETAEKSPGGTAGSQPGPGRIGTGLRRLAAAGVALTIAVLILGGVSSLVPVGAIFLSVIGLLIFSHLWWMAETGHRLPAGGRALRFLWAAYGLALLMPFVLFFAGRRDLWDELMPGMGIRWVMLWYGLMMVIAPLGIALSLLSRLRHRPAGTIPHPQSSAPGEAPPPTGAISRRGLLHQALAAAPFVITAASTAAGSRQMSRFLVRRVDIRLERLPDRLRGLTITHISDWHVGRLFTPAHLPAMIEAANRLNSDLVAVTGDLVDHNIDFLPEASQALTSLEHRYGRFVVAGNHDLIDAPRRFLEYMRQHHPGLLLDEHRPVSIDGETIAVAGLFWSWRNAPAGRDPGYAGRSAAALAGLPADRFTLALVHHPHAFEALADRGADLVLAGHTHGGQIMLTPPGRSPAVGAGSLLFRYVWGEYKRGKSTLYVNAGVGHWFPLRINAPAEIVQIRLI